MTASAPFYESMDAREQYLFFHYGTAKEYLPFPGPSDALDYPARALEILIDHTRLPKLARGLDLGCAVGRTSFELTRYCAEVVGLDLSRSFIRAARHMKKDGKIAIRYKVEGDHYKRTILRIPASSKRDRVTFIAGDAMNIPASLGSFDIAVLLNLIDSVPDPARCLLQLAKRLNPGAQLIIASPYTWMPEYTPKIKWLGGRRKVSTLTAMKELLRDDFQLGAKSQIPFLIREHARKFQWSVAEGTRWIKRT